MFYSLNEPFNYVQQAVSSTSSAALHDSDAKATQAAEPNKINKKHVSHFSAIVLPRGVTTINCYMASVNPELRATLTKRLKQSRTSPCHTFER